MLLSHRLFPIRSALMCGALALGLSACTTSDPKLCPDAARKPDGSPDSQLDTTPAVEARAPDQGIPSGSRMIELKTFAEILAAHNAGKQLRGIFKYEECKLDGGPTGMRATGGMYLVAAEYVAKSATVPNALLTFSDAKLILTPTLPPPQYDNHSYNTARVRLFDTGSVLLVSNYLKYGTNAVVMEEDWECALGGGKGAYFFVENPVATPKEPTQLTTYAVAQAAVFAGEPVTAVVDLGKCQMGAPFTKDPATDPAGFSMAVATFEWFDIPASRLPNLIVWSESNLVRDPRDPSTPGWVHRYVKISLKGADSSAAVTRQYIDPATGAASLTQVYNCALDTGDGKAGLRMIRR